MKALIRSGATLSLSEVPMPRPDARDDVLVRVAIAGLCRTDVLVADGALAAGRDPLVLGHEFAGTVESAGDDAGGLRPGTRVTVMPAIACGACAGCARRDGAACARRGFLGLDRDGAFAEFVVVPRAAVHALRDGVPWRTGAYAEPVAAALAVANAPIGTNERGVVYGGNRIARLCARVLAAKGFARVDVYDPRAGAALEPDAYDFAVETVPTPAALAALVAAVRPRGRIVLKSRLPVAVAFDLPTLVRKELSLHAVNYGPFDEALGLLASGAVGVDDLLGATHPLEAWAAVFDGARRSEQAKPFFAIGATVREA